MSDMGEVYGAIVVSIPFWIFIAAYGVSVLRKKYKRHKRLMREFKRYKKERDYWLDYNLSVAEYLNER